MESISRTRQHEDPESGGQGAGSLEFHLSLGDLFEDSMDLLTGSELVRNKQTQL